MDGWSRPQALHWQFVNGITLPSLPMWVEEFVLALICTHPAPLQLPWLGNGRAHAGAPDFLSTWLCHGLHSSCKLLSRHHGDLGKEGLQGQNNNFSFFYSIWYWWKRKSELAIKNSWQKSHLFVKKYSYCCYWHSLHGTFHHFWGKGFIRFFCKNRIEDLWVKIIYNFTFLFFPILVRLREYKKNIFKCN